MCGKQKTDKRENINLRQNIPLETRNRFAPLQNTHNEVLDKETKNYKEKEILQYRHQISVYSKQNHLPNLVINHFPENDKEQYQEIVNIVTQC